MNNSLSTKQALLMRVTITLAFVSFLASCGGSGGGASSAPVSSQSGNQGTLSDGSNPVGPNENAQTVDGGGNLPVALPQSVGSGYPITLDGETAFLDDLAFELRRRMLIDAQNGLVGLNEDYAAGLLDQSAFLCFDDAYPILDYYCGSSRSSSMLVGYGSKISGFAFTNTASCTTSLVESSSADACELEYVELRYGPKSTWAATYLVSESEFEVFESIRMASTVNGQQDTACEISFDAGAEAYYDDDDLCEVVIRSVVLAIQEQDA